jgi:hypothetical protein
MIVVFPDYTMRSRLHHRFVPSHTLSAKITDRANHGGLRKSSKPEGPDSSQTCASSPPSPREARYHRRHGASLVARRRAISSRDRSKPRKPTTFYNPLTSEDKMPNIFYSIYMFICLYVPSVVPRQRPQHIASSRRRASG